MLQDITQKNSMKGCIGPESFDGVKKRKVRFSQKFFFLFASFETEAVDAISKQCANKRPVATTEIEQPEFFAWSKYASQLLQQQRCKLQLMWHPSVIG